MEEAERILLSGLQKSIDGVATTQDDTNRTLTKHTGLLSEVKTKVKQHNGEIEKCRVDKGVLFGKASNAESSIKGIKIRHDMEDKFEDKKDKIKNGYQRKKESKVIGTRTWIIGSFGIVGFIFGIIRVFI